MYSLRSYASRLAIILSLLFLASCTQYRYNVTYEKCNGSTGSISYTGEFYYVPPSEDVYGDGLSYPFGKISNVCDFSYTKTPIK